jgi:membrane-bound lytic murein transglycosylase B
VAPSRQPLPTSTTSTTVDSPDDLTPPARAADAAALLARVETALRSPTTPAADVARLGWEQQLGYRTLRARPDWLPALLAAVPIDVRPMIEANERAGRGLATLAEPQPELPDWRIEAPPAPEVLLGYYREAEAAFGIAWPYLAAIHFVETRMGRIRGASTAGAQGPMQFLPTTWAAYGEGDIDDPRQAILAAGRYLAASGGPQDMSRALYAYNHNLRYVDAVRTYADVIATDQELAYRGYYHWQVYYATTSGVMLLPEGYPQRAAVPTTR